MNVSTKFWDARGRTAGSAVRPRAASATNGTRPNRVLTATACAIAASIVFVSCGSDDEFEACQQGQPCSAEGGDGGVPGNVTDAGGMGPTAGAAGQPQSGAASNEGGDSGAGGSNGGGTSLPGSGGESGNATGGMKADAGEASIVGGGGSGNEPKPCDMEALQEGGAILTDASGDISEDTTLEFGKSYTFDGQLRVLGGATLTIQPCVQIKGGSPAAVLGVMQGAKIEAAGSPNEPIVFTSSQPAGQRLPGDWGGIIIMGNAEVNQPSPLVDGLTAAMPYGSATDEYNDESSGTLQYVRVEFVGHESSNKFESNGITFAGVGSGTVVDHVMVANAIDDCFEWLGGTVDATHLVALNCDDDMFDTDFGFGGTVQYAFGRAFPESTEADSNGFEMDTSNDANIYPLTTAQWANVTLCGANTGTAPAASPRIGMVLRRQVSGSIANAIVTGFDSGAFSIRNTNWTPPTDIAVTSSAVFGNLSVYHYSTHPGSVTWFEDQYGNEALKEPPAGFDCYANPPVPIPDEDLPGEAVAGFEPAAYKGAFKAGENWMTGAWISWAEE